ncbi:MAG: EAL domain-containing protein (putative c-di-GMP-specific phosphodiesterase class I) [Candidatus Endobugula sp.]
MAEGAETEEEYNAVRDVGCNLIQGFYFGKPAMATDIWSGFVKVGAL